MIFTERNHIVKGLDPVADALAATVYSDVISMAKHHHCTFLVHMGVGATGTQTLTVEACDDFTPSNVSAIPFHYREILTGDTPGALTAAAAAGFTTTAGSSKIIAVEVDSKALAASVYPNVRLKSVEVVDSPCLAGIIAVLSKSRFAENVQGTAIA